MPLVIISGVILGILFLLFLNLIINLFVFYRLKPAARQNAPDEPSVSVLVPARDEAEHIERCVRSLLAQRYERLEVLVMDDNSSDATGAIVQGMIDGLPPEQQGRLQLWRGEPLPQGWVGKNFACYQLAQHATGDYLFFTDADTFHDPETVGAVLDCMQRLNVQMLTALPAYELRNTGESLVVPLLTFRVFTLLPLALVRKRWGSVLAVANGPVICFERLVYKATGGHKAVKDAIVEDVSLARLTKAAGYRMAFVDAWKMVSCYMYDSFMEMWVAFSRVFFACYGYSLPGASGILLFNLALYVFPPILFLVALFTHLSPLALIFSLCSYLLAVVMRIILTLRFLHFHRGFILLLCPLHPIAILLECALLINSIWWRYRKLGIEWKNRFYTH